MGGIYAREEGQPEAVWKAIYYHYLPVAVEATRRRRATQLGAAAVTWAAVSLADKLDTLVGLFAAGERPTGSRDPYGLRRAGARGVRDPGRPARADRARCAARHRLRCWTRRRPATAASTLDEDARGAAAGVPAASASRTCSSSAGYDVRNVRAVLQAQPIDSMSPLVARRMLEALPEFTGTAEFHAARDRVQAREEHRARAAPTRSSLAADARSRSWRSCCTSRRKPRCSASSTARRPVIERVLRRGRQLPPRVGRSRGVRAGGGPILHRRVRDGRRPGASQCAPAADEAAGAAHSLSSQTSRKSFRRRSPNYGEDSKSAAKKASVPKALVKAVKAQRARRRRRSGEEARLLLRRRQGGRRPRR